VHPTAAGDTERRIRGAARGRAALAGIVAAALIFSSAWAVYSQAKPPGPLDIQPVAGDLHVITGEGGNVAVYATPDGVVLVDDML